MQKNCEILLYTFLNQEYKIGIQKFYKSRSLRISYALFLYHYYKKNYKAKIELEYVYSTHPNFEMKFVIWRYLKKINDDEKDLIQIEEDKEQLDLVTEFDYENHYKKFCDDTLSTAKLFQEFWTIVIKNNPEHDLKRLNELCLKA